MFVERVELQDLASGRNHPALALGEHLVPIVTNHAQCDHQTLTVGG